MRVNKIPIPTVINPEYNMVVLKIEKPFDDFLTHITIAEYDEWIEKRLQDRYEIRVVEKNIVRFEYLTVLIETDHRELLDVIEHMLQEFIAYSVEYPLLYEEQIEVLRTQLDSIDGCFLNQTIKGSIFNTFSFYFPHDSSEKQDIELTINRLQQDFKQEILIYAIRDQLKSKISLRSSNDVRCFLTQVVRHYFKSMVEMIYSNLEKIGMKASIIIQKMDYYVKEEGTRGGSYDVSGFNASYGLVFHIYGYQESYCKMYKFLEKWLEGIQTLVVEVQAIECCKTNKLDEHFQNNFAKSHAILLEPLHQMQRILIFEPAINKTDLQHFFRTSKRIITGLEFKSSNFSQLAKNWNEFIDFSQLKVKVSMHEDFLIAECTKAEEKWLRQKVEEFLENYKIEEAVIQQFSNKFQLSLFQRLYRQKFSIRNVEFYILKDVLYRKNFIKDTEAVCRELGEIYQNMKRKIVWKPISKPLPQRIGYFKESRAKEWESAECLESLQFKIEDRVTVNVRSFASISRKEEQCIFVIENLKNCTEIKRILEDQGSTKIEERIIANPILGFSLRLCSFFESITTCMVTLHNTRERVWIRRLKETFESLISDHKDSRHLRFMFHHNSQESIKVLIPIIINAVKALASLRSESKIKEVTFFTSLEGGAALRKQITLSLRELRSANVKIEMITQLNLRACDIEKIVAYGYYTLKYFENERTVDASPLSSFLFNHQLKKKKKTPVFLPESKYDCQYLFNRFNAVTYRVRGCKIQEIRAHFEALQTIKTIVKQYFPITDYFAVFGDEQGTHFSTRLFYTSPQERLYKTLERADLDPSAKKITIGRQKMRYEIITNEFIELRRVETHSHMIDELMKLMEENGPQ